MSLFGIPTKCEDDVQDRRKEILEVGLALLREQGLAGLTQPRVAARVGLRQSHLTYYYPTRSDLLAAVARVAMEGLIGAVRALFSGISSAEQGTDRIASLLLRHETSRVLAALSQAADQEPAVRAVFNELLGGLVAEIGGLLGKLKLPSNETSIDLMHALIVGLPVIDLATARRNGKAHAKAALELARSEE